MKDLTPLSHKVALQGMCRRSSKKQISGSFALDKALNLKDY